MPTLTSTYLLPAILLNPAFVLHLFNTFVSHLMPPPLAVSNSPHPFMETLGPVANSRPYLDMHANDQLCWSYTAVMVGVQLLVFGRVQDNRVRRKSAKAAKLEREILRKEKIIEDEKTHTLSNMNGHGVGMDGACDAHLGAYTNGHRNGPVSLKPLQDLLPSSPGEVTESEDSTLETSEEEIIV